MELSNEDNFKLNILLNQNTYAIRIDESSMIVYALTEKGEAKVKLNPNCRDEKYSKKVRELISNHVLGSPGGYPVFLGRWTRMGQAKDDSLAQLLLLGEPEAVVAVVHAAGLSNELARRAWWCMPSAENARRMLEKEDVVNGDMGSILAEYLIEYLPFEVEARDMIESVRLVLQPGLINDTQRLSLWDKAKRKNSYYVGFLQSIPDELPEAVQAHPSEKKIITELTAFVELDNCYAKLLLRLTSSAGQTFLNTVKTVLIKPTNQDVVVLLLKALESYFSSVKSKFKTATDIESVMNLCCDLKKNVDDMPNDLIQLLDKCPNLSGYIQDIIFLSCMGEAIVNPIFSRSDAIGTVMRRKLQPVSEPILKHCDNLSHNE